MITMLPDHSMDVQSALPLSDIIIPQHKCENQKKFSQEEAPSEQVKTISNKKVLTLSNIIIFLSILFIASTAIYLYWPQASSQNKMTDMINTLIDISKNDAKLISHPNDGSTSGKGSTTSTTHSKNDIPSKKTAPIPKGQGSGAPKTIIGSGQPPSDDENDEEDDPQKDKSKRLNEDSFNSDLEDSSQDDSEDDELLYDDNDEEMNWLLPPQSQKIPFIGNARP